MLRITGRPKTASTEVCPPGGTFKVDSCGRRRIAWVCSGGKVVEEEVSIAEKGEVVN